MPSWAGGEEPNAEKVIKAAEAVHDPASPLDTDLAGDSADIPTDTSEDLAIDATINDTEIQVPSSIDSQVSIGVGDEKAQISRPSITDAETSVVKPGVVAHSGKEGVTVVTTVNADGSLQIGTTIDDFNSPTRFEYDLDIPTGSSLYELNGQVFVLDADERVIGGFAPAWAKDSTGADVPTHYELSKSTLTQVVDHTATNVIYPVVADPTYARGMIDKVKWERWSNGGWEIRFTVTALARWIQPVKASFVYTAGLAGLREHHPRSMQYTTMAQQWDCYVGGLPRTINIDLESYRRSWEDWRSGIAVAVIKGNPAKACNW